jgi:hypothetical protein
MIFDTGRPLTPADASGNSSNRDEVGEPEFYLACRSAGTKLGVCHTTAWKYLGILVADEKLEITTPGKAGKVGGRATRYRHLGP